MILLSRDCLVFELTSGESIPLCPQAVSVELVGENISNLFDPEFIQHATGAVFHYFKHDLGRDTVSVGEFSLALEKVLLEFQQSGVPEEKKRPAVQADLQEMAAETNDSELFFFPRLRDELRIQIQHSPGMVSFRGLRACVKQLLGVRRWSSRCQHMQEQILEFLRNCVKAETKDACSLLVS